VAGVASGIPSLVATTARLDPRASLACTVGVGSEFWDVLCPDRRRQGEPGQETESQDGVERKTLTNHGYLSLS